MNNEKDILNNIASDEYKEFSAYNLRKNGETVERKNSDTIIIESKKDKEGINVTVKENAIGMVNIPVIITEDSIEEIVYNDFYIGKNSNVVIIAGCGIHSDKKPSVHKGIHRFFVSKGAKVKYIEKHYGNGSCTEKEISPEVEIVLEENSNMNIETVQIKGVDKSVRKTKATIKEGATLSVSEKIMTNKKEMATTSFEVDLVGENASCHVVSRSVAIEESYQEFTSNVVGYKKCYGHVECDAIIKDNAKIKAIPMIEARCVDANLIHEAAIGKIAGEQLVKLMTLGLNAKEAEEKIINGFLK